MTSHRGQPPAADDSALPLRRPGRWHGLSFLLGLFLLAVLRLIGATYKGRGSPRWTADTDWPGWVQGFWNSVAQVFNGVAQVVTFKDTGAPLGIRLACLALLIASFWALRRALLASNGYQPGPVDVQRLIDATPEGASKPRIEDLTARFRKHLSETDLYPPTALPAELPAENFLDLLGDVNLESGKLGTSLLNLFSRLRPRVAYRVSGVLQGNPHDQNRSCGVTVTVTAFTTRGSRAHTVWESTWEEAVHEAGCWVMATILPVTRACKRPPWQAWQGRTLPPELFAAYQKGRKLSRERKFDEALHQFYKAVRWDPTNLYLRTQIAVVQEKLGLYLDALETYHGALTLGRLNTDEEDTRLWVAPWALRRFTYLWHWRQRPGILQARHRYAVVLGTPERTTRQWCHEPDEETHNRRANVRDQIREALTPIIAERYWPSAVEIIFDSQQSDYEKSAKEWIAEQLKEKNEKFVGLIFQLACQQEIRRLSQDYTIASFYPGIRAEKNIITRSALRVNRDVWAPLKLAKSVKLASISSSISKWRPPGGSTFLLPKVVGARDWLRGGYHAYVKWPASTMEWAPADLEKRIKRARTPFIRERHEHWQDHYNAACVYAVAMEAPDIDSDKLARLAYGELENAVRGAESGSVTLERSWLLSEDPDLTQLRAEDQVPYLARFERAAYPQSTPNRRRFDDPRPIHVEMAISNSQLLTRISALMELTWHRRNSLNLVEVHDAIKWFEDEKCIWECIRRVADGQARNWPDRERLLQTVQAIADPSLVAELPPECPNLMTSWTTTKNGATPGKRGHELTGWMLASRCWAAYWRRKILPPNAAHIASTAQKRLI